MAVRLRIVLAVPVLIVAGAAAPAAKDEAPLFPSEQEAEQSCPSDIVVWVDTKTRIYYFRGQQWYASTKSGGFACKREADQRGYRRNRTGK